MASIFTEHQRFKAQMEAMQQEVKNTENNLRQEQQGISQREEQLKLYKPGSVEYKDLEDGIYYFFLRECKELQEWGQTVNYRVMIDAASPEEFSLEMGQDPVLFEGKYFLSFATTDKTSGIDYYEVKEGKKDFKKAQSPYLIKDQSLTKKIIVQAYDKAGNETTAEYLPSEAKKPFPWWVIILIVIGLVAVRWIITKRRKY